MNTLTTTPASIKTQRGRRIGLTVGVAVAASALTFALTAIATGTTPELPNGTLPASATSGGVPWDGRTGSTWTSSSGWGLPAVALGDSPSIAQPAPSTVPDEPREIVVADAYHGVGISVCRLGTRRVNVADAYHGVGVSVCV